MRSRECVLAANILNGTKRRCKNSALRVEVLASTFDAKSLKGNLRMPSTRITTGGWARGSEQKIIEAVQSALLSALKIPEYDRDVVLDISDAAARIVPTGRSEHYTRIEVVMFSGRSLEAKRALYPLYKGLVTNLSGLGVPATEIKITLLEVPAENWGIRGGYPASEIDLGFKVDV